MAEKKYIDPYKAFVGAWVPNWLMGRSEVSCGAKLCYARLCQFYSADTNRVCQPSQVALARELAVGERNTRRYLDELIAHELIEESRQSRNPNRYRFLDHPWIDYRPDSERTDSSGQSVSTGRICQSDRTDMSGHTIDKENKKKRGATKFEIPDSLNAEPFLNAWSDFIKHRAEIKHPLTPTAAAKQLKQLEAWGVRRAVAAIEFSITKGWRGIFEEKNNGNGGAGNAVQRPADSWG